MVTARVLIEGSQQLPPDAPAPSEEDVLVRALREGRAEAFETLFGLYRGRIYNLVARIVQDPEDAKDVTQEVFLKAFQQIPRQNADLRLQPWLYKVAANTSFDYLRMRKRQATLSAAGQPAQPGPDVFEQAEIGYLVDATLHRLSERHRLALVLKDLHGLRYDEIALIMGVSRGAAETLLFRARDAFRRVFRELSPPAREPSGCLMARRAAQTLVGRDISPLRKRELVAHARQCPECRANLRLRGSAIVGLGLFLRQLPVPQALQTAPTMAVASPSAAGVAAAASGATTSVTATAAGGMLAKVAALGTAKVAALAAAATLVAATGGVVAHGIRSSDGPGRAAVAAKHRDGPQGRSATSGSPGSKLGENAAWRGHRGKAVAGAKRQNDAKEDKASRRASHPESDHGRQDHTAVGNRSADRPSPPHPPHPAVGNETKSAPRTKSQPGKE